MAYARCLIQTGVTVGACPKLLLACPKLLLHQGTFCDSEFTKNFFGSHFNYKPPSRKVVFGPLLDQITIDTKKEVDAE